MESRSDLRVAIDDFTGDGAVLDLPADVATDRRERFGIEADDHVAIPPDPWDDDLTKIHAILSSICRGDSPDVA